MLMLQIWMQDGENDPTRITGSLGNKSDRCYLMK
ncbi:hypothetical protein A2U01_0096622, partial [Trifolium medium]|nr:hypothetical protein [Trifolium medium]